ncbi:acyltransferase family protein [Yersinia enterocolitica]|uniref:acyltransferase family protein n=2 Tax=Yersinia enterocolitica TaxID=630 RepID=UPI0029BF3B9A|nr:acyltransferase [Yersinia enterocolitica]EKN3597305.1 acyltransferase [Yersinia enterocolitica]EKN4067555.1 acyltransferase [Yersinia enterocolitica]EKN4884692.1 acyltransferase [Yersinia enterocolitica]EKN4889046.1 acyltransferase [Yersinia enterocolitica]
MLSSSKSFRLDINGLRAWAVVAVVLYHFGVPGFAGGFIGVDVFFVISGFLMTKIIISGVENNNFSFLSFYLARCKRIIPALLFLCIFLMVFGWFFLATPDYLMLGYHSFSAVLFISNFKFWLESGYFDIESHEKWLLHTWSLSVEWQFYILLPILIIVSYRYFGMMGTKITLSVIGVASLALSIIGTHYWPYMAFYLLPMRAWEMLAGGFVWWATRKANIVGKTSFIFVLSGFFIILTSIIAFNSSTIWPGSKALIPVVGAMLVLAANNQKSIFTSTTLAQKIGESSYSIYLWHWPVVVFLTYCGLEESPAWIAVGLMVTGIAGWCSYKYIECPARVALGGFNKYYSYSIVCSSVIIVAALAVGVRYQNSEWRVSSAVEEAARSSLDVDPMRDRCFNAAGSNGSPSCVYGEGKPAAILLGDSHADATVTAMQEAARNSSSGGVLFLGYYGCPTVVGAKRDGFVCDEFNRWAINTINKISDPIPVVILNRTSHYILGTVKNEAPIAYYNKPIINFSDEKNESEEDIRTKYRSGLIKTACEMANGRPVYLVRPIPEMGVDVPKYVSRALMLGRKKVDVSISLSDYHKRHAFVWESQDLAVKACGVKILDPLPYLCNNDRCWGSVNGKPIYYDDDHLSETGNKLLTPMFKQVFN